MSDLWHILDRYRHGARLCKDCNYRGSCLAQYVVDCETVIVTCDSLWMTNVDRHLSTVLI